MTMSHHIAITRESGARHEYLVTPELSQTVRNLLAISQTGLEHATDDEQLYTVQSFDPRVSPVEVGLQTPPISLGAAWLLIPQFISQVTCELVREQQDASGSFVTQFEDHDSVTFIQHGVIVRRISIEVAR